MKSNILAEKGEIFKSNDGRINKISSKAPSHDDNIVALPNGAKKSVKSTGGVILPDANSVLSDSYTQVKNGVRNNSEMEQVVKIGKKEGNTLLEELGFSPTLKSAVSPSKLFEKALEERESQVKKLAKSENKLDVSKFSFNSKQANKALASAIPDEDDIYETIFTHQETKKEISDVDFDAESIAQYGSKPLVTNNPNDPRLQSYKDSLDLYNLTQAQLKKAKNPGSISPTNQKLSEMFKKFKNNKLAQTNNPNIVKYIHGELDKLSEENVFNNDEFLHPSINPVYEYWWSNKAEYNPLRMIEGNKNFLYKKPNQPVIYQPSTEVVSNPLVNKKSKVKKKQIQLEVYPTIPTNTPSFEKTPINFDSLELPQEEIYTPPKPREYTSGQQSYELNTDYLKRLHEENVRGKKQPPKLIRNQFGGTNPLSKYL